MAFAGRLAMALALVTALVSCRGQVPRPAQPGHYLYVANVRLGDVSGFRIDEATEALLPLPGERYLTGRPAARTLAFAPDKAFGFLQTTSTAMSFSVAPDGSLAAGPTLPSDGVPAALVIHPSGRMLFFSNTHRLDVVQLGNDGAVGKRLNAYFYGGEELSIDPFGDVLLAVGSRGVPKHAAVYTIDPATGALAHQADLRAEFGTTIAARIHPRAQMIFLLGGTSRESRMSVFLRAR